MKKQILFVLISLSVFFMSCEKDSTPTTIETDQNVSDVPVLDTASLGEELVIEPKDTEAVPVHPEDLLLMQGPAGQTVDLRGGYEIRMADFRANYTITPGQNKNSSTQFSGNTFPNYVYQRFGLYPNLDGPDRLFYMPLTQDAILKIGLTGISKNMAITLFRGSLDCSTGSCKVVFDQIVDWSTSPSTQVDYIGPKFLTKGTYFILIDGKPGEYSAFNLRVWTKQVASCSPVGTTLLSDQFDSYQAGPVSIQAEHWMKLNPSAYYDAQVTQGTNKLLHITYKPDVSFAHQPNVLLQMGQRVHGKYRMTYNMFIPDNRSASMAIHKQMMPQSSQNEVGARVYFYSNDKGQVFVGGKTFNFNYPQGVWMTIQFDWDLTLDKTTMYINGAQIGQWPCKANYVGADGSKRIEGLNFYPYATSSWYFLDKFCFAEI